MQLKLQKQGSFVLSNTEVDPTTTIDEIKNAVSTTELKKVVKRMLKAARMHASNIPGTTPYWHSVRFEMRIIHFFNAYMKNHHMCIFHTGSLAEYHEPALRLLLSKYVQNLDITPDKGDILEDDNAFFKAVQKYKNVVTHYLASKMEIWINTFLGPLFEIEDISLTFEFAKSRGAIHYHCLISSKGVYVLIIQRVLKECALRIHRAFEGLDTFINTNYVGSEDTNPANNFTDDTGEDMRQQFCTTVNTNIEGDANAAWRLYSKEKVSAIEEANLAITKLLEGRFGIHAMHTGKFPNQWVGPGGYPLPYYPHTQTEMQTSKNVLETRELKEPKHSREDHLLDRQVNISNHCQTHKCCAYCLRKRTYSMLFNPALHTHVPAAKRFKQNGVEKLKLEKQFCRLKFGDALEFDPSGEGNLTGGKEAVLEPFLKFDNNGMPKYEARRNHPRIITQPHAALYYGANNDTQVLLNNQTGKELISILGVEGYKKFTSNMIAAKMGGLEPGQSENLLEEYLTGYACKGGESSAEFEETQQIITDKYCAMDSNSTKSLRSLMGKQMNAVTGGMSVTRDQCQFILSGGKLKRNSGGTVKKCSLTSFYLQNLSTLEDNSNSADKKTFTWNNIRDCYSVRSAELNNLNVYQYCANHWVPGKEIIPQFFGYHDHPAWPLTEDYAKWTLILFKSWTISPENVKNNHVTYAAALMDHLFHDDFPQSKRYQILRAQRKEKPINMDEGTFLGPDDIGQTPTNEDSRNNEEFELAAQAQLSPTTNLNDDNYEDMNEEMFSEIPDRIPDEHDWSAQYDERLESALNNYKQKFYNQQTDKILCGQEEELLLFDYDVHRPENCKGTAQIF